MTRRGHDDENETLNRYKPGRLAYQCDSARVLNPELNPSAYWFVELAAGTFQTSLHPTES